jgi:signal transduction histidine kinase
LTNSSRSAKIAKLLNRKARERVKRELAKIQKNLKKVLDKLKKLCYNNKAAAEKASAESTLKIEQCKNSLC